MFDIIYGDPAHPRKTWSVHMPAIGDVEYAKAEVERLNKAQKEFQARWEPGGVYHPDTPVVVDNYGYFGDVFVGSRTHGVSNFLRDQYNDKPHHTNWRYALRKIPANQDFVAIEAARTDDPNYLEIQDSDFRYYGTTNFLKYSEFKAPNMLSFYANLEHALDLRRTEMKLGRFLTKFTYMDENSIADLCAKLGIESGDAVLKFADTREGIRDVYLNGPQSCMSHPVEHYATRDGIHPVEAYAAGDIAVAYCERLDDITARVMVNTKTKEYLSSYIYGDAVRLSALLDAAGYTRSDYALAGCRLLKIWNNENALIVPYIDGPCSEMTLAEGKNSEFITIKARPIAFTGNTSGVTVIL